LLSWIGLGLIAYATLIFDENTPFPSLYALVPTIGTALVILFSSKDTSSGQLLGSKAFVSVGLISYSAYLWHQPVFVFARYRRLEEPSSLLLVCLSIFSLSLAFLSWKYVEAPFRKSGIFTRIQIYMFTAIGSLIFITFGLIGNFSDGYKFRIDPKFYDVLSQVKEKSFKNALCVNNEQLSMQENIYCVLVPNKGKLAFIYGDSHVQALMIEAKKAFAKSDYGLLFSANPGCPPVKDVYRADNPDKKSCHEKNTKVYEDIVNNPLVEFVILSARWTLGLEGVRFDNKEGGVEYGNKPHLDIVENGEYLFHENYTHRKLLEKAYINSIQYLLDKGKKVILIYPVPEAGWDVPEYMSKIYFFKPDYLYEKNTASTSYQVFMERNKRTIDALDRIAPSKNLYRIRPDNIFCNSKISGRCITQSAGLIFYRDDDHLSDAGAKLVLEQVVSKLQ
jgi:hypothetical protein